MNTYFFDKALRYIDIAEYSLRKARIMMSRASKTSEGVPDDLRIDALRAEMAAILKAALDSLTVK